MTTALVCGGPRLAEAARVLGLAEPRAAPDVVLLDVADPAAVERAAGVPAEIPRVVIADPSRRELLRALGLATGAVADSPEAACIGPLIAALVPAKRQASRVLLCTAARGGVGRTLLAANLARRLAAGGASVFALDTTGSGVLAWWLRATARPWSDLHGLAHELSGEHLALVASDVTKDVRMFGGGPDAPTPDIALAATRAAVELADVVIVDGPQLPTPRRGRCATWPTARSC